MKWFVVMIVMLVVSMPGYTLADQTDKPQQHMEEITKLSQAVADKKFEPVTVVAKGANKEEALVRAARDICAHIGLKRLSPTLCKCINNVNFIPKEQCALLLQLSHVVSETESSAEGFTIVIKLDGEQLKQLAYFEMWPLFGKPFRAKLSS